MVAPSDPLVVGKAARSLRFEVEEALSQCIGVVGAGRGLGGDGSDEEEEKRSGEGENVDSLLLFFHFPSSPKGKNLFFLSF